MQRIIDLLVSVIGLVTTTPFIVLVATFIILTDRKNPIFIAERVGKNGHLFYMYKIRTMTVNKTKEGPQSTSSDDCRLLPMAGLIRKLKIDEIPQLINVLLGQMSLVGPRPNVKEKGTDLYTLEEQDLLTIKPGITDFSSIVFSDEGEILKGSTDPDNDYNKYIRPWKSRLALLYVKNYKIKTYITILWLTLVSIFSRKIALKYLARNIQKLGADSDLITIARRDNRIR